MYKIYKLIYNNDVVYIGQTICELNRRKSRGYGTNKQMNNIYKECSIELIEETDDISRERYWISYYKEQGYNLLNILKGAGLNRKEHYKVTKKEYYENNKESKLKWQKEYYELNKEYRLKYQKEYKNKNKK